MTRQDRSRYGTTPHRGRRAPRRDHLPRATHRPATIGVTVAVREKEAMTRGAKLLLGCVLLAPVAAPALSVPRPPAMAHAAGGAVGGADPVGPLAPAQGGAEIAARLVPRPQHLEMVGSGVQLGPEWRLVLDPSSPEYAFIGQWLNDHLTATLRLPVIDSAAPVFWPRVLIGDPGSSCRVLRTLEDHGIGLPETIGTEGYLLQVTGGPQSEILIAARAPAGVFYGVTTLLQLIEPDGTVPGVLIIDYPEHRMRGSYEPTSAAFEWRDGAYHFTDRQRAFIDWLAAHKMNVLFLVENGAFFRDEGAWLDAHRELFAYARARFVEPVPRLCSISTVSPFPFELAEGWPTVDERFTFDDADLAVPELPPVERIPNGGFEQDEDGDGVPDGWTVRSVPGAEWQLDDSRTYAGRYAMRLAIAEPVTTSNQAVLSVTVDDIVPESHYCVWSKAWTQDIEAVEPQLTVYVRDTMGNVAVLQSDTTRSTGRWIDFGVCLRTPANPDRLTVYARQQSPGTGTLWLDEVHMERMDGGLRNVIRGAGTDIQLTDRTGQRHYELGRDYAILNGQQQGKILPTLKPFAIQRLASGAIAPGETVLVSYDAYYAYALSRYWSSAPCLACESLYTDFLEPAIDRLTSLLQPTIINIDADEIRGFYRDSRLTTRFASNAEAIAYWANRIRDYVAARDPQCRLWLWDDMVSPFHNGGIADYQVAYGGRQGRMAEATEQDMLDRSLLMDIWWYGDEWLSQMWYAMRTFGQKGFEVLGSPWQSEENIESWSQILLGQPHALGGVETNWGTPFEPAHRVFADHFWNTRYRLLRFDSFEDDRDDDGVPDGWRIEGAADYSTDGSNCFGRRLAGFPNAALGIGTATVAVRSLPLAVRPNTDLRLSLYARTTGDRTAAPQVVLQWLNEDGQVCGASAMRLEGLGPTYAKYEAPFTSPAEARAVVIQLDATTRGVWYDVVRLLEQTSFLAILGPTRLPAATKNAPYSVSLRAVGGQPDYAWTLSAGALPPGLALEPAGRLVGTPTAIGRFGFTVQVRDASGMSSVRQYDLVVEEWLPRVSVHLPLVGTELSSRSR